MGIIIFTTNDLIQYNDNIQRHSVKVSLLPDHLTESSETECEEEQEKVWVQLEQTGVTLPGCLALGKHSSFLSLSFLFWKRRIGSTWHAAVWFTGNSEHKAVNKGHHDPPLSYWRNPQLFWQKLHLLWGSNLGYICHTVSKQISFLFDGQGIKWPSEVRTGTRGVSCFGLSPAQCPSPACCLSGVRSGLVQVRRVLFIKHRRASRCHTCLLSQVWGRPG